MTALTEETPFELEILATRGKARAGILHTPRGDIPTPVFMPVGTLGTVKCCRCSKEIPIEKVDKHILECMRQL